MEKFVRKLVNYCDICGKECEATDYKLPMITETTTDSNDANGHLLIKWFAREITDCDNVDICPECQNKLALVVKWIPMMNINDDMGNISILFNGMEK